MTQPENPDKTMREATPQELARELLGRSAVTGERDAAAFNEMRAKAGELTRAFAGLMLEHGCQPQTAAHSPYADGEKRFWVIRRQFGPAPSYAHMGSKYGGGTLKYENYSGYPTSNYYYYYDIVVDAHGGLTIAQLNDYELDYYERLDFPEHPETIENVFNVDALRNNPARCQLVLAELTRDLQNATQKYVAESHTTSR